MENIVENSSSLLKGLDSRSATSLPSPLKEFRGSIKSDSPDKNQREQQDSEESKDKGKGEATISKEKLKPSPLDNIAEENEAESERTVRNNEEEAEEN